MPSGNPNMTGFADHGTGTTTSAASSPGSKGGATSGGSSASGGSAGSKTSATGATATAAAASGAKPSSPSTTTTKTSSISAEDVARTDRAPVSAQVGVQRPGGAPQSLNASKPSTSTNFASPRFNDPGVLTTPGGLAGRNQQILGGRLIDASPLNTSTRSALKAGLGTPFGGLKTATLSGAIAFADHLKAINKGPLTINSAWGSVDQQREIKKAAGPNAIVAKATPNAPHTRGVAMDIVSPKMSNLELAREAAAFPGINRVIGYGTPTNPMGTHVHVEFGAGPAKSLGRAIGGVPVSTIVAEGNAARKAGINTATQTAQNSLSSSPAKKATPAPTAAGLYSAASMKTSLPQPKPTALANEAAAKEVAARKAALAAAKISQDPFDTQRGVAAPVIGGSISKQTAANMAALTPKAMPSTTPARSRSPAVAGAQMPSTTPSRSRSPAVKGVSVTTPPHTPTPALRTATYPDAAREALREYNTGRALTPHIAANVNNMKGLEMSRAKAMTNRPVVAQATSTYPDTNRERFREYSTARALTVSGRPTGKQITDRIAPERAVGGMSFNPGLPKGQMPSTARSRSPAPRAVTTPPHTPTPLSYAGAPARTARPTAPGMPPRTPTPQKAMVQNLTMPNTKPAKPAGYYKTPAGIAELNKTKAQIAGLTPKQKAVIASIPAVKNTMDAFSSYKSFGWLAKLAPETASNKIDAMGQAIRAVKSGTVTAVNAGLGALRAYAGKPTSTSTNFAATHQKAPHGLISDAMRAKMTAKEQAQLAAKNVPEKIVSVDALPPEKPQVAKVAKVAPATPALKPGEFVRQFDTGKLASQKKGSRFTTASPFETTVLKSITPMAGVGSFVIGALKSNAQKQYGYEHPTLTGMNHGEAYVGGHGGADFITSSVRTQPQIPMSESNKVATAVNPVRSLSESPFAFPVSGPMFPAELGAPSA